jgi:hypothetical protein
MYWPHACTIPCDCCTGMSDVGVRMLGSLGQGWWTGFYFLFSLTWWQLLSNWDQLQENVEDNNSVLRLLFDSLSEAPICYDDKCSKPHRLGVVVHDCNTSTLETVAEAEGSLEASSFEQNKENSSQNKIKKTPHGWVSILVYKEVLGWYRKWHINPTMDSIIRVI